MTYNCTLFLYLDFIQHDDAEHIRGTECDQKILSKKESSGQVDVHYAIYLEIQSQIEIITF